VRNAKILLISYSNLNKNSLSLAKAIHINSYCSRIFAELFKRTQLTQIPFEIGVERMPGLRPRDDLYHVRLRLGNVLAIVQLRKAAIIESTVLTGI